MFVIFQNKTILSCFQATALVNSDYIFKLFYLLQIVFTHLKLKNWKKAGMRLGKVGLGNELNQESSSEVEHSAGSMHMTMHFNHVPYSTNAKQLLTDCF